MATQEDYLRQIAESLTNVERLYADSMRRADEMYKESQERQKTFDEQQAKWDERQERWEKKGGILGNPWLQPGQITSLLTALALFVLSITILFLNRR